MRALATTLVLAGLVASRAMAQIPSTCSELCGVSCVKPIAIPDRWDDVTAIQGYDGTLPKLPNWRLDGKYDEEPFSDLNGNGTYDSGEPYFDGNANGKHDAEGYDPRTTGYVADPTAGNALAPAGDLGAALTLEPTSSSSTSIPANYLPIDFPPINKGAPVAGSIQFVANFSGCEVGAIEPADHLQTEPGALISLTNQAMRDLIAEDPNAYWDPITQTVQGSAFAESPRVIRVAVYDPRTFPSPGRTYVVASKVIPCFMVQMAGTGIVQVRFLRESAIGTACAGGSSGAWFYACATPAPRATWGRVKATYR